jgi:hypothetical protein
MNRDQIQTALHDLHSRHIFPAGIEISRKEWWTIREDLFRDPETRWVNEDPKGMLHRCEIVIVEKPRPGRWIFSERLLKLQQERAHRNAPTKRHRRRDHIHSRPRDHRRHHGGAAAFLDPNPFPTPEL